jgi:nitroreductase
VVVTERETLQALADLTPTGRHLAGAPLAILVAMPEERPVTHAYDDGRVTERIMLAAAAHGLGSSIAWLTKEHRAEVRRLVGLPDDRVVRTAISIGHPGAPAERPRSARGEARLPLGELVHRDRW